MGKITTYDRTLTIESKGIEVSTWPNETLNGKVWFVLGKVKGDGAHFMWPIDASDKPVFMSREPTIDEMQQFLDYLSDRFDYATYPRAPTDCELF